MFVLDCVLLFCVWIGFFNMGVFYVCNVMYVERLIERVVIVFLRFVIDFVFGILFEDCGCVLCRVESDCIDYF